MSSIEDGGSVSTDEHGAEHRVQDEPKAILNVIDLSYQAKVWQIFLLGLANVLNGLAMNWNKGLSCGFWGFMIATSVIATGYTCLIVSMAELSSIIAFSGGSYGYVRCSISPFLGYIVGICELIQNNFYVICCVLSVGEAMTIGTGLPKRFEPLWFLLSYVFVLMFHVRGGRCFWAPMSIIAAMTIALMVLYCLGNMTAHTDSFYSQSLHNVPAFRGDSKTFFIALHTPAWFFVGMETVVMNGAKIANGTSVIPKALLLILFSVIFLAIWILFTSVAIYDGDWAFWQSTDFPLSFAFHKSLGISYRGAAMLTVLPNLAGAVGYLYASKHLTQAMSLSGLLPPFFKHVMGPNHVPIRALFFCAIAQYIVLILGWYFLEEPPFFTLCLLGASIAYVGLMASFIAFRVKYAQMARTFVSFLGIPGATLGIFIFILVFLSIAVHGIEIAGIDVGIFFSVLICGTFHYYLVVEDRQGFSVEEQKRFMKAYIVNSNARRKHSACQRVTNDIKALLRLDFDYFNPQLRGHGGLSPKNSRSFQRSSHHTHSKPPRNKELSVVSTDESLVMEDSTPVEDIILKPVNPPSHMSSSTSDDLRQVVSSSSRLKPPSLKSFPTQQLYTSRVAPNDFVQQIIPEEPCSPASAASSPYHLGSSSSGRSNMIVRTIELFTRSRSSMKTTETAVTVEREPPEELICSDV